MSDSDDDYVDAVAVLNNRPTAAEIDVLRTQLSERVAEITAYLLSSREPVDKRRLMLSTLKNLMNAFNHMATTYLCTAAVNQTASTFKATLKQSIKEEVTAAIDLRLPSILTARTGPSYADMTAKASAQTVSRKVRITNGPTVIVPNTVSVVIGPIAAKESSFSSADETRKAIIKAVKPSEVNLKVNKVVNIRNKAVRIIAESVDVPKLKASPALAAAGLEIKEREKLNPRLVIRDVPTDCSSDDLVADITRLNVDDPSSSKIKVVYRYPSRLNNGLASVVIETTAEIRSKLLEQGRVFLPWHSCRIEDHLRVLQCFKCHSFGHLAKNCTAATVCGKCAGTHETSTCSIASERYKCINCVTNKLVNTDHRAFDASKCPLIKRRLTEKAKNISY